MQVKSVPNLDWAGMAEVTGGLEAGAVEDDTLTRSKLSTSTSTGGLRTKKPRRTILVVIGIFLIMIAVILGVTLGTARESSSGADGSGTGSDAGMDAGMDAGQGSEASTSPQPNKRSPQPPELDEGDDNECGELTAACSFVDQLSSQNRSRWNATDGIANGDAFGSWWDHDQVKFSKQDGLSLTIARSSHLGKAYASGQLQSIIWFEYGCVEASIKPANKIG